MLKYDGKQSKVNQFYANSINKVKISIKQIKIKFGIFCFSWKFYQRNSYRKSIGFKLKCTNTCTFIKKSVENWFAQNFRHWKYHMKKAEIYTLFRKNTRWLLRKGNHHHYLLQIWNNSAI